MSSSDGRPLANGSAGAAVAAGVLSLVTMPLAIVATRWSAAYELLDAAYLIPVAATLGAVGVALARRARARIQRTLGRAGGARAARWGRALGIAGFLVAVTAALAVGVYGLLELVASK
jgi:hypothetical protein